MQLSTKLMTYLKNIHDRNRGLVLYRTGPENFRIEQARMYARRFVRFFQEALKNVFAAHHEFM